MKYCWNIDKIFVILLNFVLFYTMEFYTIDSKSEEKPKLYLLVQKHELPNQDWFITGQSHQIEKSKLSQTIKTFENLQSSLFLLMKYYIVFGLFVTSKLLHVYSMT